MKLRPRYFFISAFAMVAFTGRFLSLFLEDLGFTETEIGLILAFGTGGQMLGTAVMSYAADRLTTSSRVFVLCIVGNCLTFTLFLLPFNTMPETTRLCLMLVIAVFRAFFGSGPILTILDALCLEYLKNDYDEDEIIGISEEEAEALSEKRKQAYGVERLWGAVGWGISNLIMGFLLDLYGFKIMVYGLYITSAIFLLLVLQFLVPNDNSLKNPSTNGASDEQEMLNGLELSKVEDGDNIDLDDSNSIAKEKPIKGKKGEGEASKGETKEDLRSAFLRHMFCDISNFVFLMTSVVISCGSSLIEGLVFLYFKDTLKASYTLCGVSVVVTVIFEIPLFAYSQELVERFGVDYLMVFGLCAYFIRVFGYTLISDDNQWLILLWEPLHGVTFACIQLASVLVISAAAPSGYGASAQAFLSTFKSVGKTTGTVIGGLALEELGSLVTYRGASLIVMATTVLYFLTSRTFREFRCKTEKVNYKTVVSEM